MDIYYLLNKITCYCTHVYHSPRDLGAGHLIIVVITSHGSGLLPKTRDGPAQWSRPRKPCFDVGEM